MYNLCKIGEAFEGNHFASQYCPKIEVFVFEVVDRESAS